MPCDRQQLHPLHLSEDGALPHCTQHRRLVDDERAGEQIQTEFKEDRGERRARSEQHHRGPGPARRQQTIQRVIHQGAAGDGDDLRLRQDLLRGIGRVLLRQRMPFDDPQV